MPKNIVICCDGTNGQFSLRNTNVVHLFALLEHDPARQVAFYDPGLGTIGAPGTWTRLGRDFTKLLGLAFAFGLKDRIGDAYRHLMEYYEPGDRIFLFGFSRGAYTVRALAALLHMFGLIRKGNENLVPYLLDMFGRGHTEVFKLAETFKPAFALDCPVHFVGVWDTVSSVGWIYDPVSLPYTANNPSIATGRHAVSIDERRCFFRQHLWGPAAEGQDLQQVWFAGVHSDIGGGYPASESGLANITLWWMLKEARQSGLLVDNERLTAALARPENQPDAGASMHHSLEGGWWVLEWWPRRYWDMRVKPPAQRWRVPRGEARFMPAGSVIHSSVSARMANAAYRPTNLPADSAVERNQATPTGGTR